MGMIPSWESLNDNLEDIKSRLRDLETARKVFSTRSLTIAAPLDLDSAEELNTWIGTSSGSSVGPDLNSVNVYSGSMLVCVTSSISTGGGLNASDAFMSYELEGPTAVGANTERALSVSWSPGGAVAKLASTYAFMHTGLTPGSYNIYSRYRVNNSGSPLSGASFKNRHILAIPF